ncbi:hypothetical protein ACFOOP_03170 [Marinicaulis aureus]|uniref:TonB C-terminal domain-containing protein n=1 Tax=Hyphococcus aureus TaxID=2666033 RepID=A0ABW1KW23_9PROT
MRAIAAILAMTLSLGLIPANAGERLDHKTAYRAQPRPVAGFSLAAKRVEMVAVTQRARADTPLRRAHLYESRSMSKVFPGYPQPAFVSVDFRLKF